MASPLLQPELSRTSLHLQKQNAYEMYEKIRIQTMRLQYEVAQIQQTLHSIQSAVNVHTASHNFDTNSTKTTRSAQGANLHAPTSIESTTGIVTDGFSLAATLTADATSTCQATASPTAITDATGIIVINNDPSIASSVDTVVLSSKPSSLTFTTTFDTDLVIDTTFIAFPASTIYPQPRPPPEPDPNKEVSIPRTILTGSAPTTRTNYEQQPAKQQRRATINNDNAKMPLFHNYHDINSNDNQDNKQPTH